MKYLNWLKHYHLICSLQQYVESVAEPQYLEQYVVATTPPTSQTSKVSNIPGLAYRHSIISVPK